MNIIDSKKLEDDLLKERRLRLEDLKNKWFYIYQFFNCNTLFLTTCTPSYYVLLRFLSTGGL